jgi:HlyD family secretion protein
LIAAGSLYFKEGKGIEVDTAIVKKGNIYYFVEEVGTVQSHNQREISINASGIVSDLKHKIGDEVKKGDILLTLDMNASDLEIKSLESRLNGLIPSYEEALRNVQNNETLYQQGAISYEAYQESTIIEQQKKSQISEIQYNIKQLKEIKETGSVDSPITGIITEIYVQEGETVLNGTPILEVADLEDLYIKVDLLTNEANDIAVNAPVSISSEDLDLSIEDAGKVIKIHPKAHTKLSDLGIEQKRVTVEIQVNDITHLKLGYDIDVAILSQSKENVLIIPETAIFEIGKEEYVFVAENGKAALRKIETGLKSKDNIEVINGISENDKVILSPSDQVEEGSQIVINKNVSEE